MWGGYSNRTPVAVIEPLTELLPQPDRVVSGSAPGWIPRPRQLVAAFVVARFPPWFSLRHPPVLVLVPCCPQVSDVRDFAGGSNRLALTFHS